MHIHQAIPPKPDKVTVIPESTKVVSETIHRGKQSAIYYCISVMLQLSVSTTEFSRSIMTVLQEGTNIQQKKTKELLNLPLLRVPDLRKVSGKDDEYENQTEIQAYQSSNQQISANRQLIQQELASAQQRAQANQKSVNTSSSESMQLLQATQAILSVLQDLTIKANLTTSSSNN